MSGLDNEPPSGWREERVITDLETACCAFMSVPKEIPSRSIVHGLG